MAKKRRISHAPGMESRRLLERLTDAYLACMLSVYLLYPGLGGYANITVEKWKLYLLLTGVYLAGAVVLRAELALVGGAALPSPRRLWGELGAVQKWILAFWACSGVSTLLAVDRTAAFRGGGRCEGFLTITLYCGSFLLISLFGRARPWMLALFGGAVTLNGLLALTQLAGYNPLTLYPAGMNYFDANKLYAGEFLGTIGNVDIVSAVLCLVIPCCWVGLVKLRSRARFALLVPLAVSLAVLFGAFVAGGVVGVCGGALLTVPVLAKTPERRRRSALAVGIVLAAGLLGIYFFGGRLGGFLYEASQVLHGNLDDSFGSGRIYIWRNVLELVPERLLFGGGPETLALRMEAAFERYDPELGILIHSAIDVAHNEYLNVLVNQGLLALAAELIALVLCAIQWVKRSGNDPVIALCGAGVLGYCIQAFFGISSPISAPYFWIALALLTHQIQMDRKE